ncbi:MAG: extracellular solute-binding protein [Lachnospiraceae bacterium]
MKKIITLVTAVALATSVLAGCNSNSTGNGSDNASGSTGGKTSNNLVVYSACNEEILSTIIPLFEEQTGIKVDVLPGGAGELLKRVESEADNPYCDVVLGGAENLYMNYLDSFQEYVSENDQYMLAGHKCFQQKLTPINTDSSVIMWNTNLIGDVQVSSYQDFLQPELKGKIALPDPATSGSGLLNIAELVWHYGDGDWESEAGWDMVRQFVTQLDGKVSGSSGNAHKSVADGENTITVTYEGAAFAYLKNDADVAIAYPAEGVTASNAMMGIVKDCKNLDNAKLFVDFLTSEEVQNLFGMELMSRPVREGAQVADFIPSQDEIIIFERDPQEVSKNSAMLIETYNEIFAEVQ